MSLDYKAFTGFKERYRHKKRVLGRYKKPLFLIGIRGKSNLID